MKTFKEWVLFIEALDAVPVTWREKDKEGWMFDFEIDGINFRVDFWPPLKKMNPKSWDVQFYQMLGQRAAHDQQDSVSFSTMVQLFLTIEKYLIELLETYPAIETIQIHPEAVGDRFKTLQKRTKDNYQGSFDINKSNAYKLLFQQSKLSQLGFTMEQHGEYLFIKRTGKVAA